MFVQKEKCDQCLFTKNRIVTAKRMKAIIKDCQVKDTFFICHKGTQIGSDDLCCRGFWDHYKNQFNLGRIAQRLKVVRFIEVKGNTNEA
jgi:hypothetical protein